MLLMKVETTFSGLSWSGAGGLPMSASPSPASKLAEKQGMMTYCRILALSSWLRATGACADSGMFHSLTNSKKALRFHATG